MVEEVWKPSNVKGKKLFVLKEKLNLLKTRMRNWNSVVFGKLDLEVDEAVKGFSVLDQLVGNNNSTFSRDQSGKRIEA